MPAKIPLRTDYTTSELRKLASCSTLANQSQRLLSVAAVVDGLSRTEAARIGGMDRQTLRDWVHRFNEDGPEGLIDRPCGGSSCRLSADQLNELAALVEKGPDPDTHGIVRWRRNDLRDEIKARFGVKYHERHVGQILHDLGVSHISARPQHPEQAPDVIEAFRACRF